MTFFGSSLAVRDFFFLAITPPRRRSRRLAAASTAAPSPDAPPPARLLDLPRELVERALSRCDSPVDIARVAAVSLLFHALLAEEAIRLWAQERGFELPAQPEDESCVVRWLCFAALLRESNPPARAAAGLLFTALLLRRKYVLWRCALVCERLRCEPWRPWEWGETTRGPRRPARRGVGH